MAKNIAHLVKEYRIKNHLTQTQLGNLLGRTGKSAQVYISNVESGKRKKFASQELEMLAKTLNISKKEMKACEEYTATKNALSQKNAQNLRELLMRQTNIISLVDLMELEKTSQRTWIVAVEGISQHLHSSLAFDLESTVVQEAVKYSIARGTPYRYLLELNPQNIAHFTTLQNNLQKALQKGHRKNPTPPLLKGGFLSPEWMIFSVMQLVIYKIDNQVVSYVINPMGAKTEEDCILCFQLSEEMAQRAELSFLLAWQKVVDIENI
ncbi:helix-turn-helix domain-containing protein [Candidatus Uabimicrobium amorphum]|uniref:HTH cro/C1-type domain-containing protein n=1 Tax=Uabimicrobium amorphum TaxID=2596890 RepID=A0A5S9ITK9_UABAM|nr:helix-turn-helix transcriptional regulator [Candidatus Uabimicrobium amorphum]BBM87191.1 hypothetical protein UABAM_05594 [Candidatus Uabimicrobium amorphum]